ncbi:MAG TPA: NAD-dependent epimerase/dehydratase family protein [Bdellovibrionota bacterium]|nr:NAD-dependent epimerase/dehydratase family protein [Bdellovibrionota bacterium]
MRCIVTGTSGFIGEACRDYLQSQNHTVISLQRKHAQGKNYFNFELGQKVPTSVFADADAFIHCAYDFSAPSWEEIKKKNIDGSIALFQASLAQGIKRNIFISSISAFKGCDSMYGQAKYIVEQFVRDNQGLIIRPGLVWGKEKGMFGRLSKISRFPILPVFDKGQQIFFLIHIEDLVKVIGKVLVCPQAKSQNLTITAAHPNSMYFKEILTNLRLAKGYKKPLFISLSSKVGILCLKLCEILKIKLPFRSDSLVSMMNYGPKPDFENLKSIVDCIRPPFRFN